MSVQSILMMVNRRACLFSLCAMVAMLFAFLPVPVSHAAINTPATTIRSAAPTASLAAVLAAPSVDDGLVSYWPFDEGSGSTSIDYGGSGNNVTLGSGAGFTRNAATLDVANPFALTTSTSPNGFASAPGNNIDTLQKWTLAFWVRFNPAATQDTKRFIALGNRNALDYQKAAVYYAPYGSGALVFEYSLNLFKVGVPYTLMPGVYYHIAYSYDGATLRTYMNGVSLVHYSVGGSSTTGNGVIFGSPDSPLDGALDDVRIYSRALSDTEVARLAFRCGGVSEIPQTECRALTDLYLNTNGAGWTNHTNWLQTNMPCSWYGVLCNNGHVFLLGLANNGLSGALPLSLNDLTGLTGLGMSGNNLSGPIPPLLHALTQLQTVDLSTNHLSGELPFQLGTLTNLHSLNLSANALSGDIATSLIRLTGLTTLNVSFNALNPTDGGVRAFLTTYQSDWAATQTVPPSGIQAKAQSATSVALTWTPIPYTADGGYYEVLASKGDGLYTSVGKTADKTATGLAVTGLQTDATYSFLVRTFTPKHSGQTNDVTSDTSDPITVIPTDQSPATITIALDTQPDSATNFSFSGSLGSFLLDDITPSDSDAYSNSKTFNVAAGSYVISQTVRSGWFLTSIGCTPSVNTSVDLDAKQLTINVASGANITCTFTTQRAGSLVAGAYNDYNHNHKQEPGDAWLGGWATQLRTDTSPLVANQVTKQSGRATFANLRPGNYTVCAMLQTGWFTITPGSNPPCYTVAVAPGTAVWTRFGTSTTALVNVTSAERATEVSDVIVCDLVSTDDLGNPTTEEFDPWEAEEDAIAKLTIFLSIVRR